MQYHSPLIRRSPDRWMVVLIECSLIVLTYEQFQDFPLMWPIGRQSIGHMFQLPLWFWCILSAKIWPFRHYCAWQQYGAVYTHFVHPEKKTKMENISLVWFGAIYHCNIDTMVGVERTCALSIRTPNDLYALSLPK